MVARLVRSSVAVTPISAIPFVYASIQMFLACFLVYPFFLVRYSSSFFMDIRSAL